jgi:hypothetical protein
MQQSLMSKNEVLLLMEEHFPDLRATLEYDDARSKLFNSLGQDVTEQYMAFVRQILLLNGVKMY